MYYVFIVPDLFHLEYNPLTPLSDISDRSKTKNGTKPEQKQDSEQKKNTWSFKGHVQAKYNFAFYGSLPCKNTFYRMKGKSDVTNIAATYS